MRLHPIPASTLLAGLLLAAVPLRAQSGDDPAAAALNACVDAADAGDQAAATEAADRADALYGARREADPRDPDPLVGLARVISQCRIPFVPMMEKGVLVGRSNGLLEKALELDPTHWHARYALALNHYYTPEFLGRTDDAIHHFEVLLDQQGDRTDFPEMAGPYAYLGDLYERVGRHADAMAVWRRGIALFPAEPRLKTRLAKAEAAASDTTRTTGTGGAIASPSAPVAVADSVAYEMAPLVVQVDGGYAMDDARPTATLSKVTVYTTPGGTADILQVFQTLPGVTRASEGSDLYVRGGDPAEAPVLLEGARLLYPGVFETLHGGVFGILDPAVLRKAYFSSGGFSARYGNALSGVVELETDGRPTVSSWRAGWNFAGAGATVRRPLGPRAGAWGSIRATETSLMLALHGRTGEYASVPRSLEGVGGWIWAPDPGLEVKAIGLVQADRTSRTIDAVGWTGPFESDGSSAVGLVTARMLAADAGASLRATAAWSRRSSAFDFGVLDRRRTDRSAGLKLEGEVAPTAARALRAGFEANRLDAVETGRVPTTGQVGPDAPSEPLDGLRASTWHTGAWLEGETRPVPALALVAGGRVDRLPGERGLTADPRLSAAWRAGDWTWRAGWGIFRQGRWRARYGLPDAGAPAGIPRRARHLSFGVEREGDLHLKAEAYAKRYGDYVPDGDGPAIRAGSASGADVLAQWSGDERWDGWLSYSLLRGRVRLADGRTVSSDYDVTHSLTLVGRVNRGPWQVGATVRYATGRPYTPILGAAPGAGFPRPEYGTPGGARLPDYFRLDARLTRFVPLGTGYLVTYVEMLNLTDRANASDVVYDERWENPRTVGSFFADRTFVAGVEIQR